MSQNNQPQPSQVQIKATDEILKGEYANAMQVMHTKEEFVMDFLSTFPPVANLVSRIIVSPGQMKLIVKALSENLSRYESQFGDVIPSEEPKNPIGFQAE